MKFAKVVFTVAGIWGVAVLTPFYWLVDITGRQYASPSDYPHFFFGFVSVALAWQIAFLLIGSNPVRYQALMVPAMIEKFGYVTTLAVLDGQSRISSVDVQPLLPDLLLGILFAVAFVKVRRSG